MKFQYCFTDFIAEHVADISRTFKGDMQMAVLLAIIGQVSIQAATAAEATGRTIQEMPPERRGITTLRLSEATSIPRETVRRKLAAMEKKGWLTRSENYWLLVINGTVSVARLDLASINTRAIARAARFYAAVTPLIGSGKD